jgi:oxygen-independent coproporphyrinogen III oxidase
MTTISLPLVQPPSAADATAPAKETTVGNYFVANYPPFGFWRPEATGSLTSRLDQPPEPVVDLGLYAHIPFCRKRCHFCYFRVYTDKNARDIRGYLDAMLAELSMYAERPLVRGRGPSFIYFGGGTPSYLSVEQLTYLFAGMRERLSWDSVKEVAFEAEPGTLNEPKIRALRELGVTRLSLGIEHFDDHVLEVNGRAHRSKEIFRAYDFARDIGFPQINIDLIAGMVEETDQRWADTIARAIALQPDSVTIYQMEVPYNTGIYQKMKTEGSLVAPVADWDTKRRWVNEAFAEFERAGYSVTAATTVSKNSSKPQFLYRQGLFDGTDLVSIGVSSFGHLGGVNYQNQHDFQPYIDAVTAGRLPTHRAYALSPEERYIREFALQMKAGRVNAEAFARKFGKHPEEQFADALARLDARGLLIRDGETLGVTRAGLLQIDRLLFEFFRPEHRTGRFA